MNIQTLKKLPYIYIGDGAYLAFTGHDFVLFTERGFDLHFIHLDLIMIENLHDHAKHLLTK